MGDVGMAGWEPIAALSREMHLLAQREEWELLVEKDVARRQLLESFFERPVRADDAPTLVSQIQALMALDGEMLRVFQLAHKEVAMQMGTIKTGHKMKAAYSH